MYTQREAKDLKSMLNDFLNETELSYEAAGKLFDISGNTVKRIANGTTRNPMVLTEQRIRRKINGHSLSKKSRQST